MSLWLDVWDLTLWGLSSCENNDLLHFVFYPLTFQEKKHPNHCLFAKFSDWTCANFILCFYVLVCVFFLILFQIRNVIKIKWVSDGNNPYYLVRSNRYIRNLLIKIYTKSDTSVFVFFVVLSLRRGDINPNAFRKWNKQMILTGEGVLVVFIVVCGDIDDHDPLKIVVFIVLNKGWNVLTKQKRYTAIVLKIYLCFHTRQTIENILFEIQFCNLS